jgi:heme/copper-type cytochrome/quinol oxidase subunit 2
MRMEILLACALIAVATFSAMLVSTCTAHRSAAPTGHARQSLALELLWAVIPCLIIVGAALPSLLTMRP